MKYHTYKNSFSGNHSFVYLDVPISKEVAQKRIGNAKFATGIKVQDKREAIVSISKLADDPQALAKSVGMPHSEEFANFAKKNPKIKNLLSKLKANALKQFIDFRGTLNKMTKFTKEQLKSFTFQKLIKLFIKIKGLRDRTLNLMEATKDKVTDRVKYHMKAEQKRSSMFGKMENLFTTTIEKTFKTKDWNEMKGRLATLYKRYGENHDTKGYIENMSHKDVMDFNMATFLTKQAKTLSGIAKEMVEYEKNQPAISRISQSNGNIGITGERINLSSFMIKPKTIGWSQVMKVGVSSLAGKALSLGGMLKTQLKSGLEKAFKKFPKDMQEDLIAQVDEKINYKQLEEDIVKRTAPTIFIDAKATADGGSYSSNLALARRRGEVQKKILIARFPSIPKNKIKVEPRVVGPGGGEISPGGERSFYKDLASLWNHKLSVSSQFKKEEKDMLKMTAGNIKDKLGDFDKGGSLDKRMRQFLQEEVGNHRGAKVELKFDESSGNGMMAVNFTNTTDVDTALASR